MTPERILTILLAIVVIILVAMLAFELVDRIDADSDAAPTVAAGI